MRGVRGTGWRVGAGADTATGALAATVKLAPSVPSGLVVADDPPCARRSSE
jgi:hypothetical protein